mmetsp:Transcript_10631/g.25992  ORF Transcript_10631/g.25992 Transcript_10631/m.25992 type:complete len:335 (-) Transcript_10631:474-1478(-)|eukprot:CAMPEP_0178999820 /NCGR_PEP_ID=MMETSP0795-20121207/10307_1 /TAXON_ID=88552 /ORGANISM="Amoebophrya sp., Strain Ameob2" /LENGTH=334 /DNA_ID=CAMNT_0020692705 /DNA_START=64 /DNA_END=1068 /DNA_ORIENTATION=-
MVSSAQSAHLREQLFAAVATLTSRPNTGGTGRRNAHATLFQAAAEGQASDTDQPKNHETGAAGADEASDQSKNETGAADADEASDLQPKHKTEAAGAEGASDKPKGEAKHETGVAALKSTISSKASGAASAVLDKIKTPIGGPTPEQEKPTGGVMTHTTGNDDEDALFRDAQTEVDRVNKLVRDLYETKFKQTFAAVREAATEREDTWKQFILGDHGLATYCSKLKALLEEVETNTEGCRKAQEIWKKTGNPAGDNTAGNKQLLIQGCADTAFKRELRSKTCETTDEKLLCTWLRESVIPEQKWKAWFEPGGKCVIGSEVAFNEPLLKPAELEQ